MKLNAMMYGQVLCPKCDPGEYGDVMKWGHDGSLTCINPDCELFGKIFRGATVEIELVEKEHENE